MLAAPVVGTRLDLYAETLATWNARINLIGRAGQDALRTRHLADSLAVLPLLPSGARRLVDLGSGAGLPGLPVAIATGIETHLVDRDQRKCAFLREAARLTAAPVVVHQGDFFTLPSLGADVLLSRATAALGTLLDAGRRHARKGGVMLLHKSDSQGDEQALAGDAWRFDLQVFANPTDVRGRLWRIANWAPRRG